MADMTKPILFNGPIEFGLRTAALLVEAFPMPLDLQRLVILDYLLVHSGDVQDGPTSLHAPSPMRAGELSIRRGFVEQGIQLLSSRGLVEVILQEGGIQYKAADLTVLYVSSITSNYFLALRARAKWAVALAGDLNEVEAGRLLSDSSQAWKQHFVDLADFDHVELK